MLCMHSTKKRRDTHLSETAVCSFGMTCSEFVTLSQGCVSETSSEQFIEVWFRMSPTP